jgi:hypothetical protein
MKRLIIGAALMVAAVNAMAEEKPVKEDWCSTQSAAYLIINRMNAAYGWIGLASLPQTPPGVVNNPQVTGTLTCKIGIAGENGVVTLTWQPGQSPLTAVAHYVSDDQSQKCDYYGARTHNATLAEFEATYHCAKRYYWK